MTAAAPPVDLNVLPELTGCDEPELLQEFLQDFATLAHRTATDLQREAAAGALDVVGQLAHRVKSSARYVGARALGDLAERLEHAAKAGQGEASADALQEWLQEWTRVQAFLDGHLATPPARN